MARIGYAGPSAQLCNGGPNVNNSYFQNGKEDYFLLICSWGELKKLYCSAMCLKMFDLTSGEKFVT